MKHGDKAKKTTKAKASIKKVIGKVAAKIKASTGIRKEASPKAPAKSSPAKGSPAKSSPAKPEAGGNGKGAPPRNAGPVTFTNAVVGNAFKRAVKKYPTAFRRLTD